ncbi:MAG: DUF5678 domain-containing protein, partial [Pirellulales bacterium]
MPANQPIVPREYAGKWIAWDQGRTQIVACGDTPSEVIDLTNRTGILEPILEKVPRAHFRLPCRVSTVSEVVAAFGGGELFETAYDRVLELIDCPG